MESGKRRTTLRLSQAEERLLIESAQHDRARFADVYDEYFEIIYAYIARRVQRRSEAEDVTAEVFRKALENLPRFKWTGAPFASWLFRIAGNTIVDRAKRASRETNANSDESEAPAKSSPQMDLESAERSRHLFRLLSELPEDQHRVITLRFAEEKSIREIAEELARSEGAVKQLQFRALENLRKRVHSSAADLVETAQRF
jgi:RNA polymerase sigma-70 factor, ECF subfamily